MTLRCSACDEPAYEPDARYCIACGGRMVEVADPEPEPLSGGSTGPESHDPPENRVVVPPPDIPAPPTPVKERGEEVPVALVLAGIAALLLVLLALLLLT